MALCHAYHDEKVGHLWLLHLFVKVVDGPCESLVVALVDNHMMVELVVLDNGVVVEHKQFEENRQVECQLKKVVVRWMEPSNSGNQDKLLELVVDEYGML